MRDIIIKNACRMAAAMALLISGELFAQTNLALNKTTTASSAISPASAAVDGNGSTRWESSQGIENSWIQVDLGADINLTSTVIDWEAANPATYLVLGSLDGSNWSTLATRTGGTFGNRTDTITLSGRYHYLRINATQRSAGNTWGYSIWEWKVFGSPTSSSTSSSSISGQSVLVQAEDYTSYSDSTAGNIGGAYHPNDNVDIEPTTDLGGGFNVGWITQGEWLEYKVSLSAGTYNLNARVASGSTTGKYSVQLDGAIVGSSSLGNTGGWQSWVTQNISKITLNTSGIHTLRIIADGSDFNFNWIQFETAGSISSSSITSNPSSQATSSSISSKSVSSAISTSSSVKSSSTSSNNSSAVATSILVQAEDFTNYLDLSTGNTGGAYRPTENVDIEATTDIGNGFNVGWISQGEWLEYKVTLVAGTYTVNARVASGATAGRYSILIDGNLVGSATVGNTGGWQAWQTQKVTSTSFNTSMTHTVRILADGGDFNLNWIQFEVSGTQSSSSSSSSSDRNHYDAPRASSAPIIDGIMDTVWDSAPWAAIDVYWLGTQHPTTQDFSGRYKAMWDSGNLYLLFDITDDVLFDNWANPLEHYWDDDSVEIFLDENKNGGNHQYNTSAWAYHVSIFGDVVDYTNSTTPKLLNNHITMRKVSVGNKHLWEMSLRVYGENYDDAKANTPLTLFTGKQMGFSACYNDNDSSSQRESMIGSVDTQGHKTDQGYINASVFGSMTLVESIPH